jgi:5-methylcytosine-specific restriction endonuclease McrA
VTLARRTPLARTSAKQRNKLRDYAITRAAVWARDRECQGPRLGLGGTCAGPLHVHHIRPRGRYPELVCDPANCFLLCGRCHRFAHDNPRIAKRLGVIA